MESWRILTHFFYKYNIMFMQRLKSRKRPKNKKKNKVEYQQTYYIHGLNLFLCGQSKKKFFFSFHD